MLVTRIAPTPSGLLHLGNAWSFTLTWLAARAAGGHVWLRIDDLDAARAQDEYLEDIFASLRWLGLDWDSGPRDVADFKARYSQTLRLDRYRAAVETLKAGGHLYACTCTRSQLRGAGPIYPGTCRAAGHVLGAPETATRFRVADTAVMMRGIDGGVTALHPAATMGDFVVLRRDGAPAYQVASVVDDAAHGVNFVVRGIDLLPSTGAQLALAQALGLDDFAPARFWHHPLVLDDANEKLSKSRGAESLAALRARFPDAAPVMRWFAGLLGWSPEQAATVRTARDLLPGFAPARVSGRSARLKDFRSFVESG